MNHGSKRSSPVALVILDGWGCAPAAPGNAIAAANPLHWNCWWESMPHTTLAAAGSAVGLLDGMPGNSAVGHMTLGAGRVVEQPITQLHHMIDAGTFQSAQPLADRLIQAAEKKQRVHVLSLVSDGAIHAHEKHLHALVGAAKKYGVAELIVHVIADGRDVPPRSVRTYCERLEKVFAECNLGVIGSIQGRSYGMDRDGRWERTLRAHELLTSPHFEPIQEWSQALEHAYAQGLSDEYIPPTRCVPDSYIHDGDALIVANIRADRMRQIVALLIGYRGSVRASVATAVPDVHTPSLAWCLTFTQYHPDFDVDVLIEPPHIEGTLFEKLAERTTFVIAETEKYAHVTYFFDGGKDREYPHQARVHIPSLRDGAYEKNPAMQARAITDAVLESLKNNPADFYLINYANADMVGHTGNFAATCEAVKVLDAELERLARVLVYQMGGAMLCVGDHGNAEHMIDAATGLPDPAHTTNSVPMLMVSVNPFALSSVEGFIERKMESLADVAEWVSTALAITP